MIASEIFVVFPVILSLWSLYIGHYFCLMYMDAQQKIAFSSRWA